MIYSKEDILVESTLACDIARISTASELMTEAYIDQMIESDTIESFFESGGSALEAIKKGILGAVQKIITFLRQQLEKLSDMLGEGEMKELMKEDPVPVLPEEYKKMLDKCDTWMSPKIPDMKEFFKLMQEADAVMDKYSDYIESTLSHVLDSKTFSLNNFFHGKEKMLAVDPDEINKMCYNATCEYGEVYTKIRKCLNNTRAMTKDDVYVMAEYGMKSVKELRAYEKKLAKFNDYLIKSFQKLEKVSSYGDSSSKRVHLMNKETKHHDEDYTSTRYGYESTDNGFDNHAWAMFLEAEESAGAIGKVKAICSKLMSNFNAMASKHSGLSTLIAGIMKQIKAFLKSVKEKKREIIAAAKKGKSVEKDDAKTDKKGDK